jgi:hypothetical protein
VIDRETVGKISSDLIIKTPESQSPIELEKAMQENYLKELIQAVQSHKSSFPADFFIIVITKNEKLMPNVFRNYFMGRISCPTPDYDQTVFRYNSKLEQIEYIWTIPSRDACIHLREHALEVVESERPLLKFVLDFADGTLMKLANKLNGD